MKGHWKVVTLESKESKATKLHPSNMNSQVMRPLGSWDFRVKGRRSIAETSTKKEEAARLTTKPNPVHPMMLGVDLMWRTVENFQNKLIINEFCRMQCANNSEVLWQSKAPKYNRMGLERKGT